MDTDESGGAVHQAAAQGFCSSAALYQHGRPDYPPQLLDWLRQALRLEPGRTALDVGAGTGKFTRLLLQTGARVAAVEPIEAMRAQLLRLLPGVTLLAASAQALPLADGSVDALLCAQAFHWFASEQTLQEFGRVLTPGGKLGLVWNVRDETCGWVAAISRIVAPYQGDTPRFHGGEWRRLFPNQLFSNLQESVFSYQHVGSARQVILDRMLSVSFIAALPPAERAKVAGRLEALIATEPQLKGRAEIAFLYLTRAYCSTRARPAPDPRPTRARHEPDTSPTRGYSIAIEDGPSVDRVVGTLAPTWVNAPVSRLMRNTVMVPSAPLAT
jgi:ubiquinone/menaquinone biosynthesis C-methylase UbiE